MSRDQLDRIEAKIDTLPMLLDWGPLRVEGWLRRFFEDSEDQWRLYQIRNLYTEWRESQEPPMSDLEGAMIGPLVYHYLWKFRDEGFIRARQRGRQYYFQRRS